MVILIVHVERASRHLRGVCFSYHFVSWLSCIGQLIHRCATLWHPTGEFEQLRHILAFFFLIFQLFQQLFLPRFLLFQLLLLQLQLHLLKLLLQLFLLLLVLFI